MNWYKKIAQLLSVPAEQQSEGFIGTPNINIRPYEPIIAEAVNELKVEQPLLLNGISDINVDLGYGQFGSVSSGSPNSVNINMAKIKSETSQQLGLPFSPSSQEHMEALKRNIKQVIVHEIGHTQDYDPEEGHYPFPGGEPAAEQFSRNYFST